MLSDRSYMRDDYPRERTSVITWIISAVIAGFVLQNVVEKWLGSSSLDLALAVSAPALRHGWLWTVLTYPLLHGGVLHVLATLLGFFFIGRVLLPVLGERRLVGLMLGASALGAAAWFATNPARTDALIGLDTAVGALFIVFACLYPNREISFLVFFVLPVTAKPKWLAVIFVGVEACGFLFGELLGGRFNAGLPHSAHLAGMAAGWLFFRYVHEARAGGRIFSAPAWMKKGSGARLASSALPGASPARPADLRAEVDRILDKINLSGFGSLTPAEKRALDEARELLSRR